MSDRRRAAENLRYAAAVVELQGGAPDVRDLLYDRGLALASRLNAEGAVAFLEARLGKRT